MNSFRQHSPTRLIRDLRAGEARTLVVYGTSLSNGMALILRDALKAEFGELVTVINAAMPGTASRSGLKYLAERVLSKRPDCVLLEWAVNDAHTYYHTPDALDKGIEPAESRENLERMINEIQAALPECEIVLQTTNPAWDPPGAENHPSGNRPHLDSYYAGYEEVAKERGLHLVDAYPLWRDIAVADAERFHGLIPDGVHPKPAAVREVLIPFVLRELGL